MPDPPHLFADLPAASVIGWFVYERDKNKKRERGEGEKERACDFCFRGQEKKTTKVVRIK